MNGKHKLALDDFLTVPDTVEGSRKLLQKQYPCIEEHQAIQYARGYLNGLLKAGLLPMRARIVVFSAAIDDEWLAAGEAYTTQNALESMLAEAEGKKH